MEANFVTKLFPFFFCIPVCVCLSLHDSEKKIPWARRVVFTVQMHFAPAPVVPQALHIRMNCQVFWADPRQLGWKFNRCFTACGGIHVITWKHLRTKVLHLLLRPKPGCPLKPESQYLICSLLCPSSMCRRKRCSKSQKSFCVPFQHPYEHT